MNRTEAVFDAISSCDESPLPILIAGVGSYHGDDQLGWLVIDRLVVEFDDSVRCLKLASPHQLLDHLDGVCFLILCDAAATGDSPGTWQRLDWPDSQIPASTGTSTHSTDWNQLLGLAHHLHPQLHGISFWLLSGANWRPGDEVTTETTTALGEVMEDIRNYVKSMPSSKTQITHPDSG